LSFRKGCKNGRSYLNSLTLTGGAFFLSDRHWVPMEPLFGRYRHCVPMGRAVVAS